MSSKTIGILGAGNVGMALAHALITKGETVAFGVPSPDKYRDAVATLGLGRRAPSWSHRSRLRLLRRALRVR